MPFLAFPERLAALYTKNFAPAARKLLILGQSVEVPGKLIQAAQKSRLQGGILITGGILINISSDGLMNHRDHTDGQPQKR